MDVIKYSPPGEIINQEYLVTKYIQYIPFTSIPFNEDCGENCYEVYGYYVKKMHQIQVKKFGFKREDNWGEYSSWYDFVCAYTKELLNKTREYSLYDEHFYNSVNEIIKQNKDALDKVVTPCMVHWDLGYGNVLVNKNENEFSFKAIIDMGRCIFGDPLWDLVDSSYKPQAFWKGYDSSSKGTLDGIIRSKIYSILDGIFDAYISLIRFDNKERYLRENDAVISSIKAILDF
ncbi:phosphotransferase [Clostridium sp. DSM 17811]|nr:phosphotransferase [Clostridium sp. DSM 17811]